MQPRHLEKLLLYLALTAIGMALVSCALRTAPPPSKPARVALVLGAGAAKGFAHVGVIKVLEANQVPVHMIVGTSAGSFVGSLYAHGFNAFQLQEMSFHLEKTDVIDFTVPDNGFIKGEKLTAYVNSILQNTPMEKLRIPFYAVATDLQSGEEVAFGRGDTGMAVRASCSIPGVFKPVVIDGRYYVDGGIVSPVAVDCARKMGADFVIAVDISSNIENTPPQGTIDTMIQAVTVMYARISQSQLARADVIIKPRVGHIGSTDFTKRHAAVLEGEKAAREAMPEIRAGLERLKAEGRL